jgi:tetratricopeptide (TPR) repeat protein
VGQLLEKLGGLPLALVQAGAYLRVTGTSVDEYLQHYGETWAALMNLQNEFPLQEYAERSVLTTWRMSYQQVRVTKPEAADLLDLWAFLSPGDIWYELKASISEREAATGLGRLTFRHLLGILASYSLATPDVQQQRFSIHPVVHAWCLHNIDGLEEREELCEQAVSLVVGMIPPSKSEEDMAVARRLLPHARMAADRHLEMAEYEGLEDESHDIAYFLSDWESSRAVERLYLRALRGYEEALGAKHTSTLDIVNNLGILYWQQGKPKEAEAMYMRALRGKEEALGAKHTSTLETVNNLGVLYMEQGKPKEAEAMYMRALRGFEEALGAKHTSTLETVNNLGKLKWQNG